MKTVNLWMFVVMVLITIIAPALVITDDRTLNLLAEEVFIANNLACYRQ